MSKDNTRLSRLGVLAPAALSVCMDASVLAVPAAGAIVSTVLKELSKAFMLKKWFYGIMSAKEAESLMLERGRNGSFLVRESQTRPGDFVLSVRVRSRVSHVMIRRQDNKYDVGSGEKFDDLVGLIEHFRCYPMIESSGDVLRLLQPLSGTRLRARDIHNTVREMQETEDVKSRRGFDGEFHSLKLLEERNVFTTYEGMKPENADKNRYRNILPYDQTRVILRNDDNSDSDYINANYIRSSRLCGSNSSVQSSTESLDSTNSSIFGDNTTPRKTSFIASKALSDTLSEVKRYINLDKINGNWCRNAVVKDKLYIATQGCLPNTTDDFWNMIWQEDVRVIAMISNEEDRGKKCQRYWPLTGEEEKHATMHIRSISEICFEDYLVRELDVSNGTQRRTIYHYQFMTWPDHGTPEQTDGVLAFIEDINKKQCQIAQSKDAPDQNVLCVHCSAGVGRTGTFIALDILIGQIKLAGFNCDIDVHSTVRLVRAQRPGMVQNRAQYKFIYLALQDFILNKNIKPRKKVYISQA